MRVKHVGTGSKVCVCVCVVKECMRVLKRLN